MAKKYKKAGKKRSLVPKWITRSWNKPKFYTKSWSLFFNTLALALLCNVPLVYYFNRLLLNTPIIKFTEYRIAVFTADVFFILFVSYVNYTFVFPVVINKINRLLFRYKVTAISYILAGFSFLTFLYLYESWNVDLILHMHQTKISELFHLNRKNANFERYSLADYSGLNFNEVSPGLLNETDINSTYGRCLRTYRWNQYIDRIEKQYGIEPHLLAGLIMQESYGNPMELNSGNDGGAGLMMFQPGTARQYGLKVYGTSMTTGADKNHGLLLQKLLQDENFNYQRVSGIDERFHVVKSMDAGARFLRDLYAIHNSWDKAISAYNRGKPALFPRSTQHVRQVRYFQDQYEKFLREQ